MRQIATGLFKVDAAVEKVCHELLWGACRVTGRASTFFTRLTLLLFIAANAYIALTTHLDPIDVAFRAIGVFMFSAYAVWLNRVLKRLEQWQEHGSSSVSPFPPVFLEIIRGVRVFFVIGLVGDFLTLPMVMQWLQDTFIVAHFYIVGAFVPPGRGWLARAAGWISQHLRSAAPLPQPA